MYNISRLLRFSTLLRWERCNSFQGYLINRYGRIASGYFAVIAFAVIMPVIETTIEMEKGARYYPKRYFIS